MLSSEYELLQDQRLLAEAEQRLAVGPIQKQARWQYSAMPTLSNHDGRSGEHRAGCRRAWVDSIVDSI